jgi:hypothetical protein
MVNKIYDYGLKLHIFFFTPKIEKREQKRMVYDHSDGLFTNNIRYTEKILKLNTY